MSTVLGSPAVFHAVHAQGLCRAAPPPLPLPACTHLVSSFWFFSSQPSQPHDPLNMLL